MAEVQPGDVHTGVDQRAEALRRRCRRSDGADNLGSTRHEANLDPVVNRFTSLPWTKGGSSSAIASRHRVGGRGYPVEVAAYEYRCRACETVFEVRRSMHDSAPSSVACPSGHAETTRVFSAVSVTGGSLAPAAPAGGGGCCGGGCCG
ncbi:zinc ribbon domain-containing protein [Cryptosporangium sp. NPDC051539]|uniref:zinc ribbon domain-containing protein n=1 Tax=Cryptosporangium sp. NPDC051539 TaxID=3363962 RepID=UPI0037A9A948